MPKLITTYTPAVAISARSFATTTVAISAAATTVVGLVRPDATAVAEVATVAASAMLYLRYGPPNVPASLGS